MTFPFTRHSSGNYRCDLFTHRYMFSGEVTAWPSLMRYLNDPTRVSLRMINVTATQLDTVGLTISGFSQDELFVMRDQVVFIRVDEAFTASTLTLGNNAQRLYMYTERFVVQGVFQVNAENTPVAEISDNPAGFWTIGFNVLIRPLLPTAKTAPTSAKVVVLNKSAVQFFHPANN